MKTLPKQIQDNIEMLKKNRKAPVLENFLLQESQLEKLENEYQIQQQSQKEKDEKILKRLFIIPVFIFIALLLYTGGLLVAFGITLYVSLMVSLVFCILLVLTGKMTETNKIYSLEKMTPLQRYSQYVRELNTFQNQLIQDAYDIEKRAQKIMQIAEGE